MMSLAKKLTIAFGIITSSCTAIAVWIPCPKDTDFNWRRMENETPKEILWRGEYKNLPNTAPWHNMTVFFPRSYMDKPRPQMKIVDSKVNHDNHPVCTYTAEGIEEHGGYATRMVGIDLAKLEASGFLYKNCKLHTQDGEYGFDCELVKKK